MLELESTELFHTSWGTACVVDSNNELKVGETITINGEKWKIKRILFPPKPDDKRVAVIIEK